MYFLPKLQRKSAFPLPFHCTYLQCSYIHVPGPYRHNPYCPISFMGGATLMDFLNVFPLTICDQYNLNRFDVKSLNFVILLFCPKILGWEYRLGLRKKKWSIHGWHLIRIFKKATVWSKWNYLFYKLLGLGSWWF